MKIAILVLSLLALIVNIESNNQCTLPTDCKNPDHVCTPIRGESNPKYCLPKDDNITHCTNQNQEGDSDERRCGKSGYDCCYAFLTENQKSGICIIHPANLHNKAPICASFGMVHIDQTLPIQKGKLRRINSN